MKTAICGVGNRLRGDDAAGPLVIDSLKKHALSDVLLIDCGSAPENFIGRAEEFSPDKVIIVDAVDMKKPAGTADAINTENISGVIFSTHNAPLALFFRAISGICKDVVFIGIQPKSTGFGAAVSAEAKAGIKSAESKIIRLIQP